MQPDPQSAVPGAHGDSTDTPMRVVRKQPAVPPDDASTASSATSSTRPSATSGTATDRPTASGSSIDGAAAMQLLSQEDLASLRGAVGLLESPGVAVRLAELIGTPIEVLLKALPDGASRTINLASETAMRRCVNIAVSTMRHGQVPPSDRFHKVAAFTSGAIGGAAGIAGLAIELPFTTTLMFRSIADIARAEGEDLRTPAALTSCMSVFALGGPRTDDDGADSAYFASRIALSKTVVDMTTALAEGAVLVEAPMLVRFITKLTARFGIVVSYKTAAQLAPIIGAVGGAVVNMLFMDHYQNMARGHFTVRRLERKYDPALIQSVYMTLRDRHVLDTGKVTPSRGTSVDVKHEVMLSEDVR